MGLNKTRSIVYTLHDNSLRIWRGCWHTLMVYEQIQAQTAIEEEEEEGCWHRQKSVLFAFSPFRVWTNIKRADTKSVPTSRPHSNTNLLKEFTEFLQCIAYFIQLNKNLIIKHYLIMTVWISHATLKVCCQHHVDYIRNYYTRVHYNTRSCIKPCVHDQKTWTKFSIQEVFSQ